jgi:nucleotide-binding universal stress UspA family protein
MFERILVPIDGSDHARRAIPIVAELAKGSGGEVRVIHLREVEIGRGGGALETPTEALDLVGEVVHELEASGVKASGEARSAPFGRAARDIVDEAETWGADLIAMGSRGLSDFAGLLLGSVAHKVIHHAGCPVLVVR